jgi:hypothetical protein
MSSAKGISQGKASKAGFRLSWAMVGT